MIVAFDFDGTLDDVRLQKLAKKLVREKNEVWIVTARKENDFNKKAIYPTLQKIGLSEYSIIFCNERPKFEMLQTINADIYIDNITDEFEKIKNYSNTIPLSW
jgi:hypothetical protein